MFLAVQYSCSTYIAILDSVFFVLGNNSMILRSLTFPPSHLGMTFGLDLRYPLRCYLSLHSYLNPIFSCYTTLFSRKGFSLCLALLNFETTPEVILIYSYAAFLVVLSSTLNFLRGLVPLISKSYHHILFYDPVVLGLI